MEMVNLIEILRKHDRLKFRYKNGHVVEIEFIEMDGSKMRGKLITDYRGKNDFWERGENKDFNIREMKNIILLPPKPKV